jgi:hypothetical protein
VEQDAGRILPKALLVEEIRDPLRAGRPHPLDEGAGLVEAFGERPPELLEPVALRRPRVVGEREVVRPLAQGHRTMDGHPPASRNAGLRRSGTMV